MPSCGSRRFAPWLVMGALTLVSTSIATGGFGLLSEPKPAVRELQGQAADGTFVSYGRRPLDLGSLSVTRALPVSAFQTDALGYVNTIQIESLKPTLVEPPAEGTRVKEAVFSRDGRLISWTRFSDEENPLCYLRVIITGNGTGASCHKQGCLDLCKIDFYVEPPPPGGGDEVVRIWCGSVDTN